MSRTPIATAACFLLLAGLWLWPLVLAPTALPYRPGAEYSDLTVSHWPNAHFLRRSLWEFGQVPLWNPDHLGGQPFAADPLAGLWYPPNWLIALPFIPLSLGFNLLLVAHLAWAGWGMFWFLRALGLRAGPAIFGGLAFSGMPKLIAHIGAGHVSLVYAVCWTPWLLLAAQRANGFRRGALAGGVLGLIFLADPRWMPMAGSAALATYLVERRAWKPLAAAAGFALAIAAVLALPLAEFLSLSTRADLSLADATELALPPSHLVGLLMPDLGGFHEFMLYPGIVVLLLAWAAASAPILGRLGRHARAPDLTGGAMQASQAQRPAPRYGAEPKALLWLGVFLVSLLFALGPTGLLQPLASEWLPGFAELRVPSRALFLAGLSLTVLSAFGLEGMAIEREPQRLRPSEKVVVAIALLALWLGGYELYKGARPAWLVGTALIILLASRITLLFVRGRLGNPMYIGMACLITTLNLLWVDSTLVEARPEAQAFADGQEAAEFLAHQPGIFRVYSPSYNLPQHVAAQYGLSQADGVNPLQLAVYVAAMEVASGVPRDAYSVTLPSFATGNPRSDNSQIVPNARALGLLNVGYVVSGFPIEAEGLVEEAMLDLTWVYRNSFFLPRAWSSSFTFPLSLGSSEGNQPINGWSVQTLTEADEVEILRWSPNKIELRARSASPVVLTGVSYPGWVATVDGRTAPLVAWAQAHRVLPLEQGESHVTLTFRPWRVYAGLGITLTGLLALGAILWRGKD